MCVDQCCVFMFVDTSYYLNVVIFVINLLRKQVLKF